MTASALFEKYDVPIPRYTSYPTVPQWCATPSTEQWEQSLAAAATADDASLAVYVHLPFCYALCAFCGCNTVITQNQARQNPYVDAVLAELTTYLERTPSLARQPFKQLHLGGGTPTFLTADTLARLIDGIRDRLPGSADSFEGSIEVDPRVTSADQLRVLRERGVTRVSMGVQDTDPEVQRLVNRHQPVVLTESLCDMARDLGYESINLDLIYGLPGQTPETMARLVEHVLRIAPDRLAVYSFARVPWIKPAQRKFTDEQIPAGADKRALYEAVRTPLLAAGFLEIGMDHFARPGDSLARAASSGSLHRNFMGYTEVHTTTLLGLGVSSISETPDTYHQNDKVVTAYEQRAVAHEVPRLRGHVLSTEDRRRRARITDLMTRFETTFDNADVDVDRLRPLVADGLVTVEGNVLRVPPAGRAFLRNAAAVFDGYLQSENHDSPIYSRAT